MHTLFVELPEDFRIPILAVLHLGRQFHSELPALFSRKRAGRVLFADDKADVEGGHIYLAPPDYHMLLARGDRLCLSVDPRVHYCRPSIDVLFESAAYAAGERVVGILLTGANEDGAEGLLRIRDYGGTTIVQDPRSAEMPVMPGAALELFTPDLTASLSGILEKMLELNTREPD